MDTKETHYDRSKLGYNYGKNQAYKLRRKGLAPMKVFQADEKHLEDLKKALEEKRDE